MTVKKRLLFVCLGNACRSAMAEKIVNEDHGGRAAADSAGTHPALPHVSMDRPTVRAMSEIGVSIADHRPKSVDTVIGCFDAVINMSPLDNDALRARCPGLTAEAWIRWEVADPRGQPENIYREVRDRLKELIAAHLS